MSHYSSSSADEAVNTADSEKAACQKAQGVCKNVVHENVSIAAKITIEPIVDIGPISTECLSKPEIVPYDGKYSQDGKCSFIVRQRICVEVPITFGASTTADPLGIACKGADVGACDCKH